MGSTKKSAQIIQPKEGQALSVVGDSYRIVAGGDATNNDYAVIDMLVPPGGGPGPHAHKDIHETFYIIEGEIELSTEDGVQVAKQGSFVSIPKGGIIHQFKNKTNSVAHLWCIVIPAGLDKFFEEIGKPSTFGKFTPPPPMDEATAKKLKAIAEKYGQEIFPPDYFNSTV
jgi:quercetin dioxygenase-like cupin family protein